MKGILYLRLCGENRFPRQTFDRLAQSGRTGHLARCARVTVKTVAVLAGECSYSPQRRRDAESAKVPRRMQPFLCVLRVSTVNHTSSWANRLTYYASSIRLSGFLAVDHQLESRLDQLADARHHLSTLNYFFIADLAIDCPGL